MTTTSSSIINAVQVQMVEAARAHALLTSLVNLLNAPEPMPGHGRSNEGAAACLEGKLRLVTALVRVLGRRSVGTGCGGGLIRRLLTGVFLRNSWA